MVLAWQSIKQLFRKYWASSALRSDGEDIGRNRVPSGKQFHHNMARQRNKQGVRALRHMCWTAGQGDKLKFLKQDGLWYLESCALKNLGGDAVSVAVWPRAATCAFVRGNAV